MKETLYQLYHFWFKSLSNLQNIFLLTIRLFWGYQFAITGWGKFMNWQRTVEFFTSLNIPAPAINVGMAASTEFFGGICLALGLGSRILTVPLIGTMLVAYATAHTEEITGIFSNPDGFFAAPPFLFLYAAVIVMLFGAGKFSVDAIIQKKG